MVSLRDAVFELDDVRALLDLSLVLLNFYDCCRRGAENGSCQQGEGCSDEGEEAHIERPVGS